MKKLIYAIPNQVPDSHPFITPKKAYRVTREVGSGFYTTADDGEEILCSWKDCQHLDGFSWTRKVQP